MAAVAAIVVAAATLMATAAVVAAAVAVATMAKAEKATAVFCRGDDDNERRRLFQLTARFDRVMGDAAYDRSHRNTSINAKIDHRDDDDVRIARRISDI